MKKTLIALAAMAAAGVASAQSSVTLFGIVDAAVQRVSVDTAAGSAKVTRMTQGAYNSSRLGVRGTEDLGGGMNASFWLEAGINNDDGTGINTNTNNQTSGQPASGTVPSGSQGLTFNRRSTVSLGGGFGEVRLGRDYTPQFHSLSTFDPFGTNGVGGTMTYQGIASAPTAARASNNIGYFLPANLGGVYGQVNYWLGENTDPSTAGGVDTSKNGRGYGVRVGYGAGPVNVAVALSKTDYAAAALGAVEQDVKMNNIGGQFDFGFARLMAQYTRDKVADVKRRGYLVGALVPVGAGEIRASVSEYKTDAVLGDDPAGRKLAVGYVHNLSKRTAAYATYARMKNKNGAGYSVVNSVPSGATVVGNGDSSGFDLGLRHSF